jgi:FKBP-type peptidyl-prolyl cis-trans isomerase (trigger factor)
MEFVKSNILAQKERDRKNLMKKSMVGAIIDASDITPLPETMIEDELERQWSAMLNRLGQKEDEYLKKVPDGKTRFIHNTKESSIEMLRTSLVLEAIARDYKIEAGRDDVITYVNNVSASLGHDKAKTDRMIADMDRSSDQFEFMKKATLNEKAVEFVIEKMTK